MAVIIAPEFRGVSLSGRTLEESGHEFVRLVSEVLKHPRTHVEIDALSGRQRPQRGLAVLTIRPNANKDRARHRVIVTAVPHGLSISASAARRRKLRIGWRMRDLPNPLSGWRRR